MIAVLRRNVILAPNMASKYAAFLFFPNNLQPIHLTSYFFSSAFVPLCLPFLFLYSHKVAIALAACSGVG